MGNSSSNSNSVPCPTKVTIRHPVFGTLSHSIASSLTTTTDTTESAPSSSLSTHQSSHSNNTTDEESYYNQNDHHHHQNGGHHLRGHYCPESVSVEDYLERRSNSFSDGIGTASSFELVEPHLASGHFGHAGPLSMVVHRPHSVLGLSEKHLSHSSLRQMSSSCTSSSTSRSSASSSPDYRLQPQHSNYTKQQQVYNNNRPDLLPSSKSRANHQNHNHNHKPDRRVGKKESNGIRVAVMPLPRSKSFHQILRPTHNGHILANNGTIRGANSSKPKLSTPKAQAPVAPPPLASKVKSIFGQQSSKQDLLSNKKRNELETILQSRLCQSETNLHHRGGSSSNVSIVDEPSCPSANSSDRSPFCQTTTNNNGGQQLQQHQLSSNKVSLAPEPNLYSVPSANNPNSHYQNYRPQVHSPANNFKQQCWSSRENLMNGKQHNSPITSVSTSGSSGAVATKIQRVKQSRNNQQNNQQQQNQPANNNNISNSSCGGVFNIWKRDLSPAANKLTINHLMSSSTQELAAHEPSIGRENRYLANDHLANRAAEKQCKIKRSVSNFDASVYFKNRDVVGAYGQTVPDNPWKLQRPTYELNGHNNKSGPPDWYSQYLSFEFLNERIKSRLQAEVGLHNRLSFATDTDCSTTDHHCATQDSAYQTVRSEDCKQVVNGYSKLDKNGKFNSKFSCSEANLATNNSHSNGNGQLKSKCGKGSSGLGKRKSFKKLIEQYFVSNTQHSDSNYGSSQESLVSSVVYGQPSSVLAQFDQNFILKRSTPNAGLTENEQRFTQSNLKEYFDNDRGIYERTWRKNRFSNLNNQKPTSHNGTTNGYNSNGRGTLSTIDRQLEMFENILNQATADSNNYIDQDSLMAHHNGNVIHRSNLSLSTDQQSPHQTSNGYHQAQQQQTIVNSDPFGGSNIYANVGNGVGQHKLAYLKMIGRSDSSLLNNRNSNSNNHNKQQPKAAQRGQTKRQAPQPPTHETNQKGLFWTPLNDLSSESDDYEDDDYDDLMVFDGACGGGGTDGGGVIGSGGGRTSGSRQSIYAECDHFVDSIVDVDVEDFIDGHQYRTPCNSKQRNKTPTTEDHDTSTCACHRKSTVPAVGNSMFTAQTTQNSQQQLPTGPCFTLSNQLKTLLHNSNRLKSQNYFFY